MFGVVGYLESETGKDFKLGGKVQSGVEDYVNTLIEFFEEFEGETQRMRDFQEGNLSYLKTSDEKKEREEEGEGEDDDPFDDNSELRLRSCLALDLVKAGPSASF